ncbi:MAG: FG-GAP-like repeat-containing protein, partial [Phycisphaerales bacterium]
LPSLALADGDGDGDLDIVVANCLSNDLSVLLGRGDGTFDVQQRFDAGNALESVALADADGDGDLDMVVANSLSGDVSVLLGRGDGTFDAQQRFDASAGPQSVALADVDGDGDADVVVANSGGDVGVLLNRSRAGVHGGYLPKHQVARAAARGSLRRTEPKRPAVALAMAAGSRLVASAPTDLGPADEALAELLPNPRQNALGQSLGSVQTQSGEVAAIIEPDGSVTALGTLGGDESKALASNDAGQVVGWSETAAGDIHAFRFTPALGMEDLGTLGGPFTAAVALNEDGETVGFGELAGERGIGGERPFLFTDEPFVLDRGMLNVGPLVLTDPRRVFGARALAIAETGRMVAGVSRGEDGDQRAIVWTQAAGVVDLNDLLPAASGWTLRTAEGFDADGAVIGRGVLDGEERAYRVLIRAIMDPDTDGDGRVDAGEMAAYIRAFTAGDMTGDLNRDGVLDERDLQEAMRRR